MNIDPVAANPENRNSGNTTMRDQTIRVVREVHPGASQRKLARRLTEGAFSPAFDDYFSRDEAENLVSFSFASNYAALRRIDKQIAAEQQAIDAERQLVGA